MIAALIILAAICNAVIDTLSHHYDTSVFRHKDRRFWDPSVSWNQVGFIKFTKWRPDAWHLFKSAMLILLLLAAVLPFPLVWWWDLPWWVELLIAGGLWNLTFNLFYNKILR